jgi:YafQ family addiction module toxin component
MYAIINSPKIDEIFKKLAKKDPNKLKSIAKKLEEVIQNPRRFKPLSNKMRGFRRIHFGSFVLTYSIDEQKRTVTLEDYDHHDNIYRK